MTIHRGGKDGSTIATARNCPDYEHATDLKFTAAEAGTFTLRHKSPRILPSLFEQGYIDCAAPVPAGRISWKGATDVYIEWQATVAAQPVTLATLRTPRKLSGAMDFTLSPAHLALVGFPKLEVINDLVVCIALILQVRKDDGKEFS